MATEIRETMILNYEFQSPLEIEIEETTQGVAIIKGTLLAEGVSKNGRLYTLDEMENIAETAEGAPIYYGTMSKWQNGKLMHNAHANTRENQVGKILHAFVDMVKRKINFVAEVLNTEKFPNILDRIKKGWGISIGGKARAEVIKDSFGRLLTKVKNMFVNHVQLLDPQTVRGQDEAQVEGDPEPQEIQESFVWYEEPVQRIAEVNLNLGAGVTGINIEED